MVPFVNLWQAAKQQIKSTDWVKLGLLVLWGWAVVPNWPHSVWVWTAARWLVKRSSCSVDSSRLRLQPPAISLYPSHLFVCFPAFVWTGDFLCKLQETRSPLEKKNPLPDCVNALQCGFIFFLCGSNAAATNNYHISRTEQESTCTEYVSGADTVSICISLFS